MHTDTELEVRADHTPQQESKIEQVVDNLQEKLHNVEQAVEEEVDKIVTFIKNMSIHLDTISVYNVPVKYSYDPKDPKKTPLPHQRLSRTISQSVLKKKESTPQWFQKCIGKMNNLFHLPRWLHIHSMSKHARKRHAKVRDHHKYFHEHERGYEIIQQMMKIKEEPVRFIWWVSIIQVIVFAIAMGTNEAVPWGIGYTNTTHTAPYFNNQTVIQQVLTSNNIWYGPSVATILQYGAKYTPCMRDDPIFDDTIETVKTTELTYGCCADRMKNCGQMSQSACTRLGGRWSSGDCKSKLGTRCVEVTLHPCCYSITCGCTVTSRQHCAILPAPTQYHTDKETCSEVSCKENSCGMGWLGGSKPNQFWRFFTPIFMHAGVGHLASNTLAQLAIGGDVESIAGLWGTAALYFITGIGGNIVSALFDPTQVSTGSSSSLYGLVGVQTVDLLMSWQEVDHKTFQAIRLVVSLILILGIGTLPWIDNFAHFGGFVIGTTAGLAFLPYAVFSPRDRMLKWWFSHQSRVVLLVIIVLLLVLFYTTTNPHFCTWCKYINCVPYTKNMCD